MLTVALEDVLESQLQQAGDSKAAENDKKAVANEKNFSLHVAVIKALEKPAVREALKDAKPDSNWFQRFVDAQDLSKEHERNSRIAQLCTDFVQISQIYGASSLLRPRLSALYERMQAA